MAPAMNRADPIASAPVKEDAAPLGFVEFVALIAALMALTALGIDSMLPALPAIGRSVHVATENERQFILTSFILGFGIAQLVHGPLADHFGRKPVLGIALASYVVANIVTAVSASFPLLLIARFIGGVAVAASRVVTVALVRDCYSGRAMARVMSLAYMVFMAAPILAPVMGSTVLVFASWRVIFWIIAGLSAIVVTWFWLRMPETLATSERISLSAGRLVANVRRTLGDRFSLGYTLASTALMGALYGFINSVQQIVYDVLKRPDLLIPIFMGVASAIAVSNLVNSRLVVRLGMRPISHGALVVLIVAAGAHLLVTVSGEESVVSFVILQAITMGCFALANSNFSAMAMENMGAIAGTASSVQGFIAITAGSIIGAMIGQSFDGSAAPLFAGYLIAGLVALAIVAVTEKGRLFRPH